MIYNNNYNYNNIQKRVKKYLNILNKDQKSILDSQCEDLGKYLEKLQDYKNLVNKQQLDRMNSMCHRCRCTKVVDKIVLSDQHYYLSKSEKVNRCTNCGNEWIHRSSDNTILYGYIDRNSIFRTEIGCYFRSSNETDFPKELKKYHAETIYRFMKNEYNRIDERIRLRDLRKLFTSIHDNI